MQSRKGRAISTGKGGTRRERTYSCNLSIEPVALLFQLRLHAGTDSIDSEESKFR
jgi:hypothetical protein